MISKCQVVVVIVISALGHLVVTGYHIKKSLAIGGLCGRCMQGKIAFCTMHEDDPCSQCESGALRRYTTITGECKRRS